MWDSTSSGMLAVVSLSPDPLPGCGVCRVVVCIERMLIVVAVTPDQAAESLVSFANDFDISKTGQFWAPRGPG